MFEFAMHSMGVVFRKANTFRRVVLPSWLRHRSTIVPLNVGKHPEIKAAFIAASDPIQKELATAVRRGRTFPYDLSVFRHVELETEYLPRLTNVAKASLDIGANVGFYSAALAPLSARVFTFEANPRLVPYLTVNLQRYSNVYLLPLAVHDSVGEVVFNIPQTPAGDALSLSAQGGILNTFTAKAGIGSLQVAVPTIAVDNLALRDVGLIKIDVEGSEYHVLKGAVSTIELCRPNIIVENEYRHNSECSKVFEFLAIHNYQGYFIDRSSRVLKSLSEFDIQQNQISLLDAAHNITDPKKYIFNFIFTPRESDPLESLLGRPATATL